MMIKGLWGRSTYCIVMILILIEIGCKRKINCALSLFGILKMDYLKVRQINTWAILQWFL